MHGNPLQIPEQARFAVALIHGCHSSSIDLHDYLPSGHCLSRARFRHLRESDWIVVTDGAAPVGLAAYKRADGEVRVVHELLLDRTLASSDATRITDVLLSALEMVAHGDGISFLTFLLRNDVVIAPFEERGYASLVLDDSGIWLQRRLGWLGWSEVRSDRQH
jgi:hypothetical protein